MPKPRKTSAKKPSRKKMPATAQELLNNCTPYQMAALAPVTVNGPSRDEVAEAVDYYGPMLRGLPGVKAVAVGLKQRRGKYAHQKGQGDEFCIVVFVDAKWPTVKGKKAKLEQRKQDGAIPERLGNIPTDVRPLSPITATAGPLTGGMAIQSTYPDGSPGVSGTIMVAATRNGFDGFVTALHVAVPPGGNLGTDVFAPDQGGQRVGVADVGGGPGGGGFDLDCSFVACDAGVNLIPRVVISGGFSFNIIPDPNLMLKAGDHVVQLGMKSGIPVEGKVDVAHTPSPLVIQIADPTGAMDEKVRWGLMQLSRLSGVGQFCQPGDSGAPVLKKVDGGYALVGLLVGRDVRTRTGFAHWWTDGSGFPGVASSLGVHL